MRVNVKMIIKNSTKSLLLFYTLLIILINYIPEIFAEGRRDATRSPEVAIPQGNLSGIILSTIKHRNISAFLGIPFAKPPIGNLRFASPVPADSWNGTLDASVDGNVCPQLSSIGQVLGDEDCLYVNVYTPQLPQNRNSNLLPVMVYIHGGGFKEGSYQSTIIGPEYLLDADVVFVSLSYRLGPLGFLSTGDEVAPGNWALKDQILALKWIRDNIKYFGGNPDQVTLFGESAGAGCTHLLSLSDLTIGLFHRYIMQSGSALAPWAHQSRAACSRRSFHLGGFVGCYNDTSASLIECLRTINFADIIVTDPRFHVRMKFPDVVWSPTDEPDIEGAVITDSPRNLINAGKIRDLPLITGIARDEGLLHSTILYESEDILNEFVENFDELFPLIMVRMSLSEMDTVWIKAVKSYYLNTIESMTRNELLSNITKLIGDCRFLYPAYETLQMHNSIALNPQYFYEFNYRGTMSYTWSYGQHTNEDYGVAHADDLIYLFPHNVVFYGINKTMKETDYRIIDTMVQLWTSFAINGKPTASVLTGGTFWEPYSSADGFLRIGNNSDVTLEMQYSFLSERMQFWNYLYETTSLSDMQPKDSGTGTLSANIFLLMLIICLQFVVVSYTMPFDGSG